jgi:hypothetical protein
VGLGHRITSSFKYEIQYIYQNSRQYEDDGLKSLEHLLRLRLFLVLRSKSSVEVKQND